MLNASYFTTLTCRMYVTSCIKFCHDLGKTPALKMIKETKRKTSISRSLFFKLHRRFSDGQGSLKEDAGRGSVDKLSCRFELTSLTLKLHLTRRIPLHACFLLVIFFKLFVIFFWYFVRICWTYIPIYVNVFLFVIYFNDVKI